MDPNIGAFIQSKLNDFKNSVAQAAGSFYNNQIASPSGFLNPQSNFNSLTQPVQNLYQNAQPIVQPLINTAQQGAQAFGRLAAYQNPVVNMNPTLSKQAGVQNNYSFPQMGQDIGKSIAGYGAITAPIESTIGGVFGAGLSALGNVASGKPWNQNLQQNYNTGVNFAAGVGPIGKLVGAAPIFNTIANKVESAVPIASQKAGALAANVAKQFGTGAAYGALQGENPLTTGLQFAPYGLMGAGKLEAKAKGTFGMGRIPKTFDPNDVGLSDTINDILRSKKPSEFTPADIQQILPHIDNLANKYLKNGEIDKVMEQVKQRYINGSINDQTKPYYTAKLLLDAFRKKAADMPASYADSNAMNGLNLGFVNKNNSRPIPGKDPNVPDFDINSQGVQMPSEMPGAVPADSADIIRRLEQKGTPNGRVQEPVSQPTPQEPDITTTTPEGKTILTPQGKNKVAKILGYTKDETNGSQDFADWMKSEDAKKVNNPVAAGEVPPQGPPPKGPTQLPTDENAQYGASLKGGNFTGNVDPEIKNAYKQWVFDRQATKIEGIKKAQDFSDLDAEGMKGIQDFQDGMKSGKYAELKNYFDTKRQSVQDAGIDLRYKQDYLPQLWKNDPQEVEQKLGRTLGLHPSFTLQSVFKNYKEGIEAGLTPRFDKVSDLVGWYEQRANKAIADKKFFDFLASKGYIQPQGKQPPGWKAIDPNVFPRFNVKTPDGVYGGNYYAPEPVKKMIENYLVQPNDAVSKIGTAVTKSKNIVLTGGIPNTGINMHGVNILARHVLSSNNPVGGLISGVKYLVNPNSAEKFTMSNLGKAADWAHHGLTFNTEGEAFKPAFDELTGNKFVDQIVGRNVPNWYSKMFEEPLFQKIIPALKIQHAEAIAQDLSKSMPLDQAKEIAAKQVNSMFGGVNWEAMGKDRSFQNVLKMIVLAPDWAKTNIATGKGIVQGLLNPTNPEFKVYRTFARNLTMAYVAANVANKAINGHYMFQNAAGHGFDIQLGYTADGKPRYFSPFGTAVDFARLPVDVATSLAKGDLSQIPRMIRNRLSTPLGTTVGLISNTDYRGQPIVGRDKYGKMISPQLQLGNVMRELGSMYTPPAVSSAYNFATGQTSPEEAVSQLAELPFKYGSLNANTANQQAVLQSMKDQGLSGQQLNNQFNLYKLSNSKQPISPQQVNQYLNQPSTIQQGFNPLQGLFGKLNLNFGNGQPPQQTPATPAEQKAQQTAQDSMEKTKLLNSNQPYSIANGNAYIVTGKNTVQIIPLQTTIPEPNYTGNQTLDTALSKQYNTAVTNRINQIAQLVSSGAITSSQGEQQLASLQKVGTGSSSMVQSMRRRLLYNAQRQPYLQRPADLEMPKPRKTKLKPVSVKTAKIKNVKPTKAKRKV